MPTGRPRNTQARLFKEERGAIAPITGVSIALVVGVGALAFDVTRVFNMHNEMQNAVDAAAVAGATQLDGEAGARDRAIAAAQNAFVTNIQAFASDGLGSTVSVNTGDITFLQDLETRAVATDDANAEFIRIELTPRDISFSFAGVVSEAIGTGVGAAATAGFGKALCKVPPLMICNMADLDIGNLDAERGRGIVLKSAGSGGSWVPGNFGFLAPDSATLGANALRDALGRINPRAECIGTYVTTEPGANDSVRDGFNVRFDMFSGTSKFLTNNPQYMPARSVIKGRVKSGSQCSESGSGWTEPENPYEGPNDPDREIPTDDPTTPIADAMALPRDNCAYPGGSCYLAEGGGRIGDGVWGVADYFTVNYGNPDPIAVSAGVLSANPTRHDVYQWELSMADLGLLEAMHSGVENVSPTCWGDGITPVTQQDPDRRTISAVILECTGEVGRFSGDGIAFLDLFLTEPMGKSGSDRYLYAEILGETGAGVTVGAETLFRVVQLYE